MVDHQVEKSSAIIDESTCPNCREKLNYFESVKVKREGKTVRLNQCPKCSGYFKAVYQSSAWFSLSPILPMLALIVVPEKYPLLQITAFGLMVSFVVVFAVIQDRKRKREQAERGYWVALDVTE